MIEVLYWTAGFWVICGVISYGLVFGYFQREFPNIAEKHYRRDMNTALVVAFGGPFGLLGTLCAMFSWGGFSEVSKHGFKWR